MRNTIRVLSFCFAFLASQFAVGATNNYAGIFQNDDDVATVNFVLSETSFVDIFTASYASGGFDPIITLYNFITGDIIAANDDNSQVGADGSTGNAYDSGLIHGQNYLGILDAGSYAVAITQYSNFANGPNISAGFGVTGNPTFTSGYGCSNGSFCDVSGSNRTTSWALTITTNPVPEPSTWLLMGVGLMGLLLAQRRRAA